RRAGHPITQRAGPVHLRPGRRCGRALGARPEARPLRHARRARAESLISGGSDFMSGTLVLVRHGQSEWNLKNLFTGWRDPDLTELGIQEAETGGQALADAGLKFDVAFTSVLKRAQDTLTIVLDKVGQPGLETIRDQALNERDYGDPS